MKFKVLCIKGSRITCVQEGETYLVKNGTLFTRNGNVNYCGDSLEDLNKWYKEFGVEFKMVETEKPKPFTINDLKVGMVISCNHFTRVVVSDKEYYRDGVLLELGVVFKEDGSLSGNIKKITYGDEVVYQKKEYMTLKEASNTGKRFKHKDSEMWYTSPLTVLNLVMKTTELSMFEVLDLEEFEVEE